MKNAESYCIIYLYSKIIFGFETYGYEKFPMFTKVDLIECVHYYVRTYHSRMNVCKREGENKPKVTKCIERYSQLILIKK